MPVDWMTLYRAAKSNAGLDRLVSVSTQPLKDAHQCLTALEDGKSSLDQIDLAISLSVAMRRQMDERLERLKAVLDGWTAIWTQ